MLAKSESALSRIQAVGVRAASLVDLVAVGLAESEIALPDAEERALTLIQNVGRLKDLGELTERSFMEAGCSRFASLKCLAMMELGRRLGNALCGPKDDASSPEAIARLLDWLRYEKREHFIVVLLDTRNRVMKTVTVHIGTLTMSVVGAREVFREAIREGASSIVVAHNHPSGNPEPSVEDKQITSKLVEVGQLVDIPVLDHIVLGEGSYVSFVERGLLG